MDDNDLSDNPDFLTPHHIAGAVAAGRIRANARDKDGNKSAAKNPELVFAHFLNMADDDGTLLKNSHLDEQKDLLNAHYDKHEDRFKGADNNEQE